MRWILVAALFISNLAIAFQIDEWRTGMSHADVRDRASRRFDKVGPFNEGGLMAYNEREGVPKDVTFFVFCDSRLVSVTKNLETPGQFANFAALVDSMSKQFGTQVQVATATQMVGGQEVRMVTLTWHSGNDRVQLTGSSNTGAARLTFAQSFTTESRCSLAKQ